VPQRAPALIERPRGSGLARLCRHGRILGDLSLTGRPSRASPRTTPARVFPSPSPENDRACLQERVCAPHTRAVAGHDARALSTTPSASGSSSS
jgi:hypothetical protein